MKWGIFFRVLFFSILPFSILSFSISSYSEVGSEPQSLCLASDSLNHLDSKSLQDISSTESGNRLSFGNLKILVWNIYKEGKSGIFNDLNELTQKIDLAFFQEGYLNKDFLNLICSKKDLNWKMAKSFADDHGLYSGVITASHQNPSLSFALASPDPESFSNIHKMMLINLYDIPGRSEKLLAINIHGLNFVLQQTWENQINVIARIVRSHRGPVVLAGDFNTYTGGRTQYLLNTMKKSGLTHGDIYGNEYQGLVVLDHLFYRGFEETNSGTIASIKTSDHSPLYFELRLLKN